MQHPRAGRDQTADADLDKAEQCRGRPRISRKRREGQRRRIGIGETRAGEQHEKKSDDGDQPIPSTQRPQQKSRSQGHLADQRGLKDPFVIVLTREHMVQLAAADKPDRQESKDPAILFCAQMKIIHKNCRRTCHINKKPRKSKSTRQGEHIKSRLE